MFEHITRLRLQSSSIAVRVCNRVALSASLPDETENIENILDRSSSMIIRVLFSKKLDKFYFASFLEPTTHYKAHIINQV